MADSAGVGRAAGPIQTSGRSTVRAEIIHPPVARSTSMFKPIGRCLAVPAIKPVRVWFDRDRRPASWGSSPGTGLLEESDLGELGGVRQECGASAGGCGDEDLGEFRSAAGIEP